MSDKLKHMLLLAEEGAPPAGHEARFRNKLNARKGKSRRIWIATITTAAAIAAGFIIYTAISGIQNENEVFQKRSLADVSPQTKALELQMTEKINRREAEVDFENPVLFDQIQVYRSLQTEFVKLEDALNLNFGDERLIRAMMDNYQHRLKVLENILLIKRLHEQNHTTNYEQANSKS